MKKLKTTNHIDPENALFGVAIRGEFSSEKIFKMFRTKLMPDLLLYRYKSFDPLRVKILNLSQRIRDFGGGSKFDRFRSNLVWNLVLLYWTR